MTPATARKMAANKRSIEIDNFAKWIVANGGTVMSTSDDMVRYRSIAGEGSLTLTGSDEVYSGDARVAFSCFRCGSTLSPFALRPVEPPRTVQSLRARAAHTATIIADASFDHETGAAGWAAWMIADGMESAIVGASLRYAVADIGEAELIALANALESAEQSRHIIRGSEVLLQSDSLWALAAIRKAIPSAKDRKHATAGRAVQPHRKAQWSERARLTCDRIVALVDRLSLTVAVRHVPGHTAGDGRQWVNRRCDAEAKRHMRAARDALAASPDRRRPGGAGSPT